MSLAPFIQFERLQHRRRCLQAGAPLTSPHRDDNPLDGCSTPGRLATNPQTSAFLPSGCRFPARPAEKLMMVESIAFFLDSNRR